MFSTCVNVIKKLDGLFGKTKCSVLERNSAKNKIFKNIYGDRKVSYEGFGLAESQDKPDLNAKHASLKEKWEIRCPYFYYWFMKHRNKKFENSVIASVGDGLNVFGMFFQSHCTLSRKQYNISKINLWLRQHDLCKF